MNALQPGLAGGHPAAADAVPRLVAWAKSRRDLPFVWGETNCVQLCLEAAEIMGAAGLGTLHRGKYASAPRALRYMRRHRLTLAGELARMGFGQPWGNVLIPGDILAHRRFGEMEHGYVLFGPMCLTSTIEHGVCSVMTEDVLRQPGCKCWRKN